MDLSSYLPETLFRKYKSLRRELLAQEMQWLDKRIAILGGSTTTDMRKILELSFQSVEKPDHASSMNRVSRIYRQDKEESKGRNSLLPQPLSLIHI